MHKLKTLLMMLVVLLLGGAGFASCDEFLSSNDNPVSPNLKVQTTSLTVQVGKTAKCKATANSKARLTYFSSDESIATVSTSGLVKGISVGTTYVTALATNPAGSDSFLEESAIITVNVVEKENKENDTSEKEKTKAIKLLEDAQKEGALVTIYFTLDVQDYVAYFKLVDGEYVLQEPAGTRGVIQWSNKGNLKISLKSVDISSTGAATSTLPSFTIVDQSTGKTVMQCLVDTQTASYAVVSAENCSFGGMEVEAKPLTLTRETLEEIFGDTPVRVTDDGTIEVWDGNQWVDPTKEETDTATMTVTAEGFSGTYDGEAHGIKVTAPEGATVKYGEAEGTYDKTSSPTYTDAGTYTVYYQVTKEGYTTVTNSATVTIAKAAGTVSFETTAISKMNTDAAFTNALTKTGDGKVTYSSSDTNVATVDANGEVTITGAGEATITATVADGTNYTYATLTAEYTLTVSAESSDIDRDGYENGENPF